MKKFSITKKVSLLLAAFAVCVMAACVSLPVKAAAGPFALSQAAMENFPTTNYIYLESTQSVGSTITSSDLKYSLTDPNVASGSGVTATYLGMLDGKYVYKVDKYFSPASTVYLKYQNADVLVGVTAPNNISTINQVNATANAVTISWPAASGASGYMIYAGTTTDNVAYKGTAAGTSYTVAGLAQDGRYVVEVVPYKTNGKGFNATWFSKARYVYTTAGKISGVKLSASNEYTSQYKISWSQAGANNADGFEIMITNKSGKKITSATEEKYLDYIFKNNKLRTQGWKVKVRAYLKMDNGTKVYGPWSAEKVIVPNAYIKSTKLVSKSGTDVKLTWTKVSGAKSYTVYRSNKATGKYKKVATVKGTSYTMKKLAKYKYYYVYVKANKVKVGKKSYNSTTVKNPGYRAFRILTRYY
ncbi:MAG: fibronectin type III domain-containing protein [Lachnospiraceae bacterium]|nr:fibronectin type III domain-containing protein [Lachnospiraceae bacterium]